MENVRRTEDISWAASQLCYSLHANWNPIVRLSVSLRWYGICLAHRQCVENCWCHYGTPPNTISSLRPTVEMFFAAKGPSRMPWQQIADWWSLQFSHVNLWCQPIDKSFWWFDAYIDRSPAAFSSRKFWCIQIDRRNHGKRCVHRRWVFQPNSVRHDFSICVMRPSDHMIFRGRNQQCHCHCQWSKMLNDDENGLYCHASYSRFWIQRCAYRNRWNHIRESNQAVPDFCPAMYVPHSLVQSYPWFFSAGCVVDHAVCSASLACEKMKNVFVAEMGSIGKINNSTGTYHSGSSVPRDGWTTFVSSLTFWFKPGKLRRTRPSPITWPRFNCFGIPFPKLRARPRLRPALLTDVTDLYSASPVAAIDVRVKKKKRRNWKLRLVSVVMFCCNTYICSENQLHEWNRLSALNFLINHFCRKCFEPDLWHCHSIWSKFEKNLLNF